MCVYNTRLHTLLCVQRQKKIKIKLKYYVHGIVCTIQSAHRPHTHPFMSGWFVWISVTCHTNESVDSFICATWLICGRIAAYLHGLSSRALHASDTTHSHAWLSHVIWLTRRATRAPHRQLQKAREWRCIERRAPRLQVLHACCVVNWFPTVIVY